MDLWRENCNDNTCFKDGVSITMNNQVETIFLSHGGGPLPLLGDPQHREMVARLTEIANSHLKRPEAIIVISAHWEEPIPTITAAPKPELIYDYYGFPQESYNITYPVLGNPELAQMIYDNLKTAGIPSKLEVKRGFDHGLFVPLKIMFPRADIPCVQLSLKTNLNPKDHIEIGKALSKLPYSNLLIIGSGFSFHNLNSFFNGSSKEQKEQNNQFQQWLIQTISSHDIDELTREEKLINWSEISYARYCHPREEHLLPLHVCYGINQCPALNSYSLQIMEHNSSMFIWK